jgi:hypothetical protein
MFRWKQKRLLDKQREIGNRIYRLKCISGRCDIIYTLLCRRKKGNIITALKARENKLTADRMIERLKDEDRLIKLELKPYQT